MCARLLICAIMLALVAVYQSNAMTWEQIEKTSQSLRSSCVTKVNADMDVVLGIQKGAFPEDRSLKCYTHCILKKLRTFKNGRIDGNMMISQLDLMMPADIKEFLKDASAKCSQEPPAGDDCQTAFNYVKCCYQTDSVHFFFP